jgi:hypothetical protein
MGLLEAAGVDASIFPPIMDNGRVIAELRKELAAKIVPGINGALCSWHRMTPLRRWLRFLLARELPSCRQEHGRS